MYIYIPSRLAPLAGCLAGCGHDWLLRFLLQSGTGFETVNNNIINANIHIIINSNAINSDWLLRFLLQSSGSMNNRAYKSCQNSLSICYLSALSFLFILLAS